MDEISIGKLDEGISMCLANARRLLNDANLLHERGRHSSARVLAMYSWEEAAKAKFILECKQDGTNISMRQWRKNALLHVRKLDKVQELMDIHSERIFNEEGWEIELREEYGEKDHSVELKEGREGMIYIDFDFQENRWVSPESHFVLTGDAATDSEEVIGIAERCIEAVRLEIELEEEARLGAANTRQD